MEDRLFRHSIKGTGEMSAAVMLLCQSVFLGIFYGSFDVTAHSIFLSVYDEKMMARAYIVSGFAGIILTSLYSRYNSRIQFRNLAFVNLLFITAVTLVLWILILLNPAGWVIFLVFIMLGPLNILAMMGFRDTLRHLFTNLRPGRNFYGLVEGGVITGIIISCFAIPLLLKTGFKLTNIFIISATAAFAAMVIQVMTGHRILHGSVQDYKPAEDNETRSALLHIVRDNPYVRKIAIFTSLAAMTTFFVQYSFMATTREQYPAMEDMARFLGLFTGSIMLFTLIIKFLIFPYLISNFGLRSTLVLSPFLIAVIAVIIVVTGFLMGYTQSAAGFTIFFMLLALSRLFSRSLKESVEAPSVKVICSTVDAKIRYKTEAGMTGILNEFTTLLSGLVLTLLGILSFVKLIHFPLVLILIAVLWLVAAFRLYSAYRDSVRKTSESIGQTWLQESAKLEKVKPKNRVSAEMEFTSNYFSLITGDPDTLERNNYRWFLNSMLDHADAKTDINLLPVLKKVRSGSGIEKEIRQRSADIISNLEIILSEDRHTDDKIFNAMMILSDSHRPPTSEVLKLLRDKNNDLKKIAICLIGKFEMNELLPEICDCLGNPDLEVHAESVLRSFKEEADQSLRRFYILSSANINICKRVLRLIGTSSGRENEEFLFSLLWTGPRQTKEAALKSLVNCNYKIQEEEKERILHLISDVIGVLTWNLSAGISIKRENNTLLHEALDKENESWYNFLFDLLTITYNAGSVKNIRENIEKGTIESVSHALEMIDILVDESLKSKLIPLLDNLSDRQKLNILFKFYPGEIPDYNKLIIDIINRDYNLLGVWIRACVIRNIPAIKEDDMAESLIALLFSPELILREETAKLLSRSGKEFFRAASDRIPDALKGRLENIINGRVPDRELLYGKVSFVGSLFLNLPEEDLLSLAGEMKFAETLTPDLLPRQGGYILWECNFKTADYNASLYYEDIMNGLKERDKDTFCYVLPLVALEGYLNQFPEHSSEILNYINEIE